MNKPRFQVGDLVDVRSHTWSSSNDTVTRIKYVEGSLRGRPNFKGYIYQTASAPVSDCTVFTNSFGNTLKVAPEFCVFPHNKPGMDTFEEMMEKFNSDEVKT